MKLKYIIKFLNRTANPEESRLVLTWLAKPGARKEFDELLNNTWSKSSINKADHTDYDKLLQQIHSRIGISKSTYHFQKRTNPWHKIFKVAASIVLIMGSIIFLKKGIEFNGLSPAKPERAIERKTGTGEKLTLNLLDGTTIVLNAYSSISISSDYGNSNRLVKLNGEGYFEIAKDSLRPFKVQTEGIVTTALGTAFNTIAKTGYYAVAITEGKVSIETNNENLKLTAGQMAVLDNRENSSVMKISSFETDKVVGWKEGLLNFERVQLKEILEDLAIWYGVKLKIEEGVNVNKRVIGTFRNKNLEDVLTGLGFSMGFQFDIDNNHVLIKKSSQ